MYFARDKSLADMALKHRNQDLTNYDPQLKKYLVESKQKLEKNFPDVSLKQVFNTVSKDISLQQQKVAQQIAAERLQQLVRQTAEKAQHPRIQINQSSDKNKEK